MELITINYKNSLIYFQDFYNPVNVAAYSFQLSRKFDFGNIYEGDYLVVYDNGKPLLNWELKRSNSFLQFEHGLHKAIGIDEIYFLEKLPEALSLILEYYREAELYNLKLLPIEFKFDQTESYYDILKRKIEEFGYLSLTRFEKYYTIPSMYKDQQIRNFEIKKFIDFSVEERKEFIINYDERLKSGNLNIDTLYLDYLEHGQVCESLWETVFLNGHLCAYFLCAIDNKNINNNLELFNYVVIKQDVKQELDEVIYSRLNSIAIEENCRSIVFCVNENNQGFIDLLKSKNAQFKQSLEIVTKSKSQVSR